MLFPYVCNTGGFNYLGVHMDKYPAYAGFTKKCLEK